MLRTTARLSRALVRKPVRAALAQPCAAGILGTATAGQVSSHLRQAPTRQLVFRTLATEAYSPRPLQPRQLSCVYSKEPVGTTRVQLHIMPDEDGSGDTQASDSLQTVSSLPEHISTDLKAAKHAVEYQPDGSRVVHVTLCKESELQPKERMLDGNVDALTKMLVGGVTRAVSLLQGLKLDGATIVLPSSALAAVPDRQAAVKAIVSAALLKTYAYDIHKTEAAAKLHSVKSLCVTAGDEVLHDAEAEVFARASVFARELVNERSDVANPAAIAAVAEDVAQQHQLKVHRLSGLETLREKGLHLMASVGMGSRFAPELVCLEYDGAGSDNDAPVLLVGKGITFDTGGLNLKPTGFIENMHIDMGGSAAVLAAMKAIAELKIKRKVVAVLGLAENAIGRDAYKPMDIIKSLKGITVEVGNTDAEGRLVLADALTYAQQRYKPSHVVDIATLTGACVVALGPYAAGLFANNPAISQTLVQAGRVTGETIWPLPILDEHREELKGKHADVSSTGESRYGGACTAAAFLEKFIEKDTAWAHVDIAGPAETNKARGVYSTGATGFGAQLLCRFVMDLGKQVSH